MSTRLKNIFIFLITILLAGGVYIWFYPMNKGSLSVTANQSQYSLLIDGESILCDLDPCKTVLKSGFHNITAQKSGYLPETINIQIKRGDIKNVSIDFKKTPVLNPSSVIPEEKQTLKELPFLDSKDDKLKIRKEGGELKIITTLKNIRGQLNLYLSSGGEYLLGNVGYEFYFIDIKKTSRKKQVSDFVPKNITWSPGSKYLLMNNLTNELYMVNFATQLIEPIEVALDLNNAVWSDENNLIYFDYDEEGNQTTINHFDVLSAKKTQILTKNDFPIEKIVADEDNIVYFYNPDLASWHQLDF